MSSKRTLASKSSLDTTESREVLASIKRGLRRVKRAVQMLQPMTNREPEQPIIWDVEQYPFPADSASLSNVGEASSHAGKIDALQSGKQNRKSLVSRK